MKAIKLNTAIAKDNGEYADAGSVVSVPGDVSEDRAIDMVDSGFAVEFDPDNQNAETEAEAPAPTKAKSKG